MKRKNYKQAAGILVALAMGLFWGGPAKASSITFEGWSDKYAASAAFDVEGTKLLIHLANVSTADVTDSSQVLTGLFFDIAKNPTLTPVSATLEPGTIMIYNEKQVASPKNMDVGGEWAYKSNVSLTGNPSFPTQGISCTGLGIFGTGDRFPGADLDKQTAIGGVGFGLLPIGDNIATGNGGMSHDYLIKYSTDFMLSGLPDYFDVRNISNVHFQYGTDLKDVSFAGKATTAVPEPGSMAVFGTVLGMVILRRRRAAA